MLSLPLPVPVVGLTFLGLFVVYYVVSSIIYFVRLRHIPGPALWAWTRIPLIRTHLKGDSYEKFGQLTEKYGSLVRIGPNYVVTSDPEIVRRLNASRSPYTKSNWYIASRFTPGIDNMISNRDDAYHDVLRKKAMPAYSGRENPQLERDVDETVLDLVRLIRDRYLTTDNDQPVKMELARKAQYFTTDTISLLAFREKFNDLKDDTDHFGYIEEVETLYPNMFCTSVLPEIMEFFTASGLLALLDPAKNPKFAFGKVMAMVKQKIDARLDPKGGDKEAGDDMLGSFIKHGMTRQELDQEVIVQV